jgi:hypothetical protein
VFIKNLRNVEKIWKYFGKSLFDIKNQRVLDPCSKKFFAEILNLGIKKEKF